MAKLWLAFFFNRFAVPKQYSSQICQYRCDNSRWGSGEASHLQRQFDGISIFTLFASCVSTRNLKRNGADFSVFVNTAQEFDGSDSGARPDEAVSWGKIKGSARPVKVHCDATIAFPILVSETFAKRDHSSFAKALFC